MSMLCWVVPRGAIRSLRKQGITCSQCQSICWVRKPDLRKEKNKTLTGYDDLCNYLHHMQIKLSYFMFPSIAPPFYTVRASLRRSM